MNVVYGTCGLSKLKDRANRSYLLLHVLLFLLRSEIAVVVGDFAKTNTILDKHSHLLTKVPPPTLSLHIRMYPCNGTYCKYKK